MIMNEEALDNRHDSYRWNSKQELCDYFSIHYGLNRTVVEAEITEVTKLFRVRRGRAINTPELWQKVGLHLEKKIKEIDP